MSSSAKSLGVFFVIIVGMRNFFLADDEAVLEGHDIVIISAFVRGMKSDFSSRELLGERMDDREWCRPSSIKLDEDFIILDILERSVRIASIPFCAPVL